MKTEWVESVATGYLREMVVIEKAQQQLEWYKIHKNNELKVWDGKLKCWNVG
jgi:hypothetical protein